MRTPEGHPSGVLFFGRVVDTSALADRYAALRASALIGIVVEDRRQPALGLRDVQPLRAA